MKNYDVLNELVPKTRELHREIFDKGYEQGVKDTLEQRLYEDCISREEALMALTGDITDCTIEEYIARLRDKLSKLPSITPKEKTEWIPVSERLPEADEYIGDVAKYYLVQNEYGDMLVARYTHSEYWEQIYQLKPIADKIVAWMPLPKPYKAESEKEE